MIGQRFHRLTVMAEGERATGGSKRWRCLCDCEGAALVTTNKLRSGHTKSCGCWRKQQSRKNGLAQARHGHSSIDGQPVRSRTYRSWSKMRERCLNPNHVKSRLYRERGITICERWDSFENFLVDMGERPEGRSLDRIDPDGNYEPSNCRWATPYEQRHNRSKLWAT